MTDKPRWTPGSVALLLACLAVIGGFVALQMAIMSRQVSGQMAPNPGFGPEWECTVGFGVRAASPSHCLRIPPEARGAEPAVDRAP